MVTVEPATPPQTPVDRQHRLDAAQHGSLAEHLIELTAQEIAHALRLPRAGAHMRVLTPFVRPLSRRFADLAAAFDTAIPVVGFREAVDRFTAHFVEGRETTDAESVPTKGPLIVASNHPGATDAFAVIASLPRDDAALVISDVPITRALPHTSGRFIYVSGEMESHVAAVREMTDRLKGGGTVVIFPSANLTPDPAIATEMGGPPDWTAKGDWRSLAKATFARWSHSILLPLRRVPECRIQPAIVSGVQHPRFARHWLTRYIPASRPWERQLLAEVLQVMHQLRTGDSLGLRPHVRFGLPVEGRELAGLDRETAMAVLVERAAQLLAAPAP